MNPAPLLFFFATFIGRHAPAQDMFTSFEEHVTRARGVGAVFIVNNGDDALREISSRYMEGLLGSYEEHLIFDEPHTMTRYGEGDVDGRFRRRVDEARRLLRELPRLLRRMNAVDIFIASHSNIYDMLIDDLPASLRRKIRLVYNTGCSDARRSRQWLDLGVGAYVGHAGFSFSVHFLDSFRHWWWAGYSLERAVARGNRAMADVLDSHLGEALTGGDTEEEIESSRAHCRGDCGITIGSLSWRGR